MPTLLTPFADGVINNLTLALGGNNGEPTALLSDDQSQVDLWFTYNNSHPYCASSTDGSTFSGFTSTDIPNGYKRGHCLKDGSIYYFYAATGDTSIHLFTGTNKINWTDQGQVLGLGSGWDGSHISNCFVWREGATWYMLYEGQSGGGLSQIGLATATAAAGPWTRYGSNPVIPGASGTLSDGCGNPELPRFGSTVTKYGGLYYCYFHGVTAGNTGPQGRAHSADLHTWTVEGNVDGVRETHTPVWNGSSGWSYGDQCLYPFGGKTILLYSPSNQVDTSYIDGSVDHRSEVQLMACPPNGAVPWTTGAAPQPI